MVAEGEERVGGVEGEDAACGEGESRKRLLWEGGVGGSWEETIVRPDRDDRSASCNIDCNVAWDVGEVGNRLPDDVAERGLAVCRRVRQRTEAIGESRRREADCIAGVHRSETEIKIARLAPDEEELIDVNRRNARGVEGEVVSSDLPGGDEERGSRGS